MRKEVMKTLSEIKTHVAVLRMTRFSTKRKGDAKKELSKKSCRKKIKNFE
jgi:hypothetical protein